MKAQLICVKCLEQSLAHTNGSYYYSLMLPHQLMNKSYGRTLYVPMLYSMYAYVLCIYICIFRNVVKQHLLNIWYISHPYFNYWVCHNNTSKTITICIDQMRKWAQKDWRCSTQNCSRKMYRFLKATCIQSRMQPRGEKALNSELCDENTKPKAYI